MKKIIGLIFTLLMLFCFSEGIGIAELPTAKTPKNPGFMGLPFGSTVQQVRELRKSETFEKESFYEENPDCILLTSTMTSDDKKINFNKEYYFFKGKFYKGCISYFSSGGVSEISESDKYKALMSGLQKTMDFGKYGVWKPASDDPEEPKLLKQEKILFGDAWEFLLVSLYFFSDRNLRTKLFAKSYNGMVENHELTVVCFEESTDKEVQANMKLFKEKEAQKEKERLGNSVQW